MTKTLLMACILGAFVAEHPALADVRRNADGFTIEVNGTINTGDATKFSADAAEITRHPHLWVDRINGTPYIVVMLNSTGGNVKEAMEIGRMVRHGSMSTFVEAGTECDSACALILVAGVRRTVSGKIGLHRPTFDPKLFAGLSESTARDQYNAMINRVRDYFINEMGGSLEAFRQMINTPSSSIRYLTSYELYDLGLAGEDPAFAEHSDARLIDRLGREGFAAYQRCLPLRDDMQTKCVVEVIRRYGS
jgi:ATP-dependent protease ClpP protease subunit